MTGRTVHVAGIDLGSVAPIGDLEDSTIWRLKGYSGDYEASLSWAAPRNFSAEWLHRGASFEIRHGGVVEFVGFLGEPTPGAPWELVAFGSGADAANYQAIEPTSSSLNAAIDEAAGRGMRWIRGGNDFNVGTYPLAPADLAIGLDEALDRQAASAGKVWYVTRGVGSLRAERTDVDWLMAQDSAYLGTTDENFVTSLKAFYFSALDGDGNPATPVYTDASHLLIPPTADPVAAARMGGAREAVVDVRALGQLNDTQAYAIAAARFAQVGARAGFTNGFEMTTLNSTDVGGVPDPMGVRAGDRIRVPGPTDLTASPSYSGSVTVTAGKVRRLHGERRALIEPVGLVERDFAGALAAAQAPQEAVEVL